MTRMIQINLTLLLKVISHGDDVHKLQQLVPQLVVHVTDISLRLVIGLSSTDDDDGGDD